MGYMAQFGIPTSSPIPLCFVPTVWETSKSKAAVEKLTMLLHGYIQFQPPVPQHQIQL